MIYHITFIRCGKPDTYAQWEGESHADAVRNYVDHWLPTMRNDYNGMNVFVQALNRDGKPKDADSKFMRIYMQPPAPPVPVTTVTEVKI